MKIVVKSKNLRELSQIMSPANFKRIIRKDDSFPTYYRIKKHTEISEREISNLEAINEIYDALLKNYKNEYVFKNILINKLLLKKYSLKNTVVLNEFKIGNSIADFVLLNGECRVYEIKTGLDSLEKLDKQTFDYCRFSDKVYIVASYKHIDKLVERYKDSKIGIIELTLRNALKIIQEATQNKTTLKHEVLFKTLRKKEYLDLIREHYNSLPEVPNTLVFKECLSLAKKIDIDVFQKLVLNKLKERNITRPDLIKDKSVPESLKHVCYTLNLSKNEYDKLNSFLNASNLN